MFDFGFSEMILVAVVALIVVGPQRLPKVARTVGHLLGRLQRYVSDVKADVSREMQLEELKKLQEQVRDQARDLESSVRKQADSVESSLKDAGSEVRKQVDEVAESARPPMSPNELPPVAEAWPAEPVAAAPLEPESPATGTPGDVSRERTGS